MRFFACKHSIGIGGGVVATEVLVDDGLRVVGVVLGNVVGVVAVEASVVLAPDDGVEGEAGMVGAEESLAWRQEMSRSVSLLKSFFSTARCSSSEAEKTSLRI